MKRWLKKLRKYFQLSLNNRQFKDTYDQNKQEIINNLNKRQWKEKDF